MKRILLLIPTIAAMLFAAAGLALADTSGPDIEPEFYRCLEAADADEATSRNECIGAAAAVCIAEFSTASGKANCFEQEAALWDALLNESYQELRHMNLSRSFRDRVRKVQKNWIAFRDTNCNLYAEMGIGGAQGEALKESCKLEQTALRANQLGSLRDIARQVAN
ncbi:lysozyme inhibitor LprI family protein [Roseibium sp.]|uniref:lysozyme inhibitor LprI family protein n=1 Tax=Roseibium sp. TaxID=1936156 RepID=UPI003A97CD13